MTTLSRTNASGLFLNQQKKRDPAPPGCPAPAPGAPSSRNNGWKQDVPTVEQLFHALGLTIYKRGGRTWTHSPWKRMGDRTPSCLIFPEEGRFWDFATGRGGNAITLARIANPDRQLSFKDALLWLRSKQAVVTVPSPRYFPTKGEPVSTFVQMLENREKGGEKAPRPEGLYRLAWRIYREQFGASQMEYIKPFAVVGLLVKALAKNAERVAVEDALQMAITGGDRTSPRSHITAVITFSVFTKHGGGILIFGMPGSRNNSLDCSCLRGSSTICGALWSVLSCILPRPRRKSGETPMPRPFPCASHK
jgi:hypothetical protein